MKSLLGISKQPKIKSSVKTWASIFLRFRNFTIRKLIQCFVDKIKRYNKQ